LGGDVEVHFMHYLSEGEAQEKWERRLKRLVQNPNRLFIKFDDRDLVTAEQVIAFDRLPFRNKVFFTTAVRPAAKCAVRIPLHCAQVPNGLKLSRLSPIYFDTVKWIVRGGGKPGFTSHYLSCL
jgi:uncharacterized protein (DUF1919 family)